MATYQNGTWVNEGKTFAHEVDKAGYNRNDVAMLMQQNAGELVKYIRSSELAEDETQTVSYQISYRALGLKNAYMPYFSDSRQPVGRSGSGMIRWYVKRGQRERFLLRD